MSPMRGEAPTEEDAGRTTVVGIDVGKATRDVFVHPSGTVFRVRNDTGGIDRSVGRLTKTATDLVAMDATGRHSRAAGHGLRAAVIPGAMVSPRRSRRFADVIGRLAKTDEIDAEVLARFRAACDHQAANRRRR